MSAAMEDLLSKLNGELLTTGDPVAVEILLQDIAWERRQMKFVRRIADALEGRLPQ